MTNNKKLLTSWGTGVGIGLGTGFGTNGGEVLTGGRYWLGLWGGDVTTGGGLCG